MITVIGLTGVKGSGKTTVFEYIKGLNANVVEVMLAGKLKDACSEVFEVDRVAFDAQSIKEKELDEPRVVTEETLKNLYTLYDVTPDFDTHIRPHLNKVLHTPREIAQYVGTEVLRKADELIHLKAATKNMESGKVYVVTDIRFWNEYDFFKDNEKFTFYPFYIANYGAEARGAGDTHASERYVLEIGKRCEKLDNNGTLDELRMRVTEILGEYVNASSN